MSENNTKEPRYKVDFSSTLGRYLVIDSEQINGVTAFCLYQNHADKIAQALNNSGAYLKLQESNKGLIGEVESLRYDKEALFQSNRDSENKARELSIKDDRISKLSDQVMEAKRAYAVLDLKYCDHKEQLRKAVNRCADQTTRIEQLEAALKDAIEVIEACSRSEAYPVISILYQDKARVLRQALTLKRSDG